MEPAARPSPSARRGTRWTAPRRVSLPERLSRVPARRAPGRGGTARRTRSPRRAPRGPGRPGPRDLALASSVRFRRALARAAPRRRLSDGIDHRRRAPARARRCSEQRRRAPARRAGRRRLGSPSDRRAPPRGFVPSRGRPDRFATRAPRSPDPRRTRSSTQRCSAAPCAGFLYAGRVKASSSRSDRTEQQAGRQGARGACRRPTRAARAGSRASREPPAHAERPVERDVRGRPPQRVATHVLVARGQDAQSTAPAGAAGPTRTMQRLSQRNGRDRRNLRRKRRERCGRRIGRIGPNDEIDANERLAGVSNTNGCRPA